MLRVRWRGIPVADSISGETFKYRKEAVEIHNKINDIDVQLKALTSLVNDIRASA